MTATERLSWLQIVRVPAAGVDGFQRYEDIVLPLLPAYGGRLDARYRSDDSTVEVHVVSFASAEDLDAYRRDQRRQAVTHMLAESQATTELLRVSAVDREPGLTLG